jgi:SAM-dependent methyltransferase
VSTETEHGEHRVASHLGVDAEAYDVAIRRWIPGYEQMVNTIIRIVSDYGAPLVVDLGTGTGALGCAILDALPNARAILVDIDPNMLAVAGARVAKHGARAELRRASFLADAGSFDELPACDAVVASLALHHVPDLEDKAKVYAHVYRTLKPGGVFLLGDATVHDDGPEHEQIYAHWEDGMADAGIPREQAAELFAQWALEDTYYPLTTELPLLEAAGFARPDVFWKSGAITVYGGFK